MRLQGRLAKLEGAASRREANAPCGSCGHAPGPMPRPQIRVVWEGEEVGPERCPGCGRKLVVEIAFDVAG